MSRSTRTEAVLESFARTTDEIYNLDELRELLSGDRQIRIKYGVDATAPLLHLGHAVNLWMMRELQDLGHRVVFLLGDFTTRVGDPTGRSKTRPVIPTSEIEANVAAFLEQVGGILLTDREVFEVRRNSEWWAAMPTERFLSLLSMVTYRRLIGRDMFQRRIADNAEIYLHELIYPVLQGYDSYELESDLTIVGTEQLFNELMGRVLQERLGQRPQVVITTKITPGIDGREKQSKSIGNYISIAHSPREMYGRVMSIPDSLIASYFEVYTKVPMADIQALATDIADGKVNPMAGKRALARAVVERYHGPEAAENEDHWFKDTFSQRTPPADAPEIPVGRDEDLLGLLRRCLPNESNTALRRLIQDGAVEIGGTKCFGPTIPAVSAPTTLRVGKRRFFRLVPAADPTG